MESRIRLVIDSREPFAEGQDFGSTGPYEVLQGRAYYAVDPNAPENKVVVDLDKAPRSSEGLVECSGDVCIIKPVDMSRGNGRLVYDVVNRGATRILQSLNDSPPSSEPRTATDAGNGFLMRRGYTLVYSGLQGDLVPGVGNVQTTMEVPVATDNGREITGPVRVEFVAPAPGAFCFPLSGSDAIQSYETVSTDTSKATFSYRKFERDPRTPIPPDKWQFARLEPGAASDQGKLTPSTTHCYLSEGFRPGWIYELVYEAKNPLVMGLGYVGVRELVDFLRYRVSDDAGNPNPLREQGSIIEKAYGWGRSQSGRLLRGFVYWGFNQASQGRRVFDGIVVHVAGIGIRVLNHRFIQPGRYSRQHEDHLYPSNLFPFSYAQATDPFTKRTDAILKRPKTDPLVIHTQTSTEYWQMRGSLVHTDPLGNDLPQPQAVRLYLFSSAQHFYQQGDEYAVSFARYPINPLAYTPACRAMLDALDRWVTNGVSPPPNRLPTRKDGTLVPESEAVYPRVPDVQFPVEANHFERTDHGPQFEQGIITQEPPLVHRDQKYAVLVPQVDADGNEIAGVRDPEIQAPLATHVGWNLRNHEEFDNNAIASLSGSRFPFAQSEAERKEKEDPRPSVEERYPSKEAYLGAVKEAVDQLLAEGFILQEDAQRYMEDASRRFQSL